MAAISGPNCTIKLPGRGQHAVANHFGLQATTVALPPQAVVFVDREVRMVGTPGTRSKLIGVARDDQAMDVLHAPIVFHQLDREPIEQLRQRGLLSGTPKDENTFHKRPAEVPHPDVVHRDASG